MLVRDLARIAYHLGELTAAARDRWADWGTVTPHLQRAEALAADATRCLSHAAGTYAFNTTLEGEVRPTLSLIRPPQRGTGAAPRR